MAESTEDFKISLSELPGKSSFYVNYEVKMLTVTVPNFFILPEYNDKGHTIYSQSFDFSKATWQLEFETNDGYQNGDSWIKEFCVSFIRLNSEADNQVIFYNIVLLGADDKKYEKICDKFISDENEAVSFNNEKRPYDRRDSLTFIIHLMCEESPTVEQLLANDIESLPEETRHSKISLCELPWETLSSVSYMVKVPNFFTLPEYEDGVFKLNSPPFHFANATWQLRFQPGWNKPRKGMSFEVRLMKLNSELKKHSIIYTTTLLDANDKKYSSRMHVAVFEENVMDAYLGDFNNKEISCDMPEALTLYIDLDCDQSPVGNEVHKPLSRDVEKLCDDLKKLFLNPEDHDLTLKVGEKEFHIHRGILKSRCSVFNSMLTHDMIEKNKGVINTPDCDPQSMEQFLLYVYCGHVETINEDNVFGLYYITDKYDMVLLKEKCSTFIKKSFSSSIICDAIELSLKHSDADLLESATEYFVSHTSDILSTPQWISFMKSNTIAANELFIKACKKWETMCKLKHL